MIEIEHIKTTISARHCDQKWKTCNEKNRITDRHIKRDDSRKKKVKSIIKLSQVPLTSYKGITKPKKAPLSFKFMKIQKIIKKQQKKVFFVSKIQPGHRKELILLINSVLEDILVYHLRLKENLFFFFWKKKVSKKYKC